MKHEELSKKAQKLVQGVLLWLHQNPILYPLVRKQTPESNWGLEKKLADNKKSFVKRQTSNIERKKKVYWWKSWVWKMAAWDSEFIGQAEMGFFSLIHL